MSEELSIDELASNLSTYKEQLHQVTSLPLKPLGSSERKISALGNSPPFSEELGVLFGGLIPFALRSIWCF